MKNQNKDRFITEPRYQSKKNFGYKIIETLPLNEGIEFIKTIPPKKSFSRKHVIAELASINPACVCCGVIGTKFCLGIHSDGGKHWDLYTDDDFALSVDHIIPRSKGGRDHISNTQIMCTECNNLKSNIPERIIGYKILIDAGVPLSLITHRVHVPFLRIGYWKKLSNELLSKVQDYFTEESIYDEDTGWLYTYYFKH